MNRLFLATNPLSIVHIAIWTKLVSPDDPFLFNPMGFNWESRRFETMDPGRDYQVVIVSDESSDPLAGVTVDPCHDYLIYHENSKDPNILARFAPARMIPSSHINNTKKSAFARVLSELANGLPSEGVDALIKELMPDAKREITLFLCGFERMPELPKSLEGLRGEYEEIRKLEGEAKAAAKSSGDHLFEKKKEFIRKCIEIHDNL